MTNDLICLCDIKNEGELLLLMFLVKEHFSGEEVDHNKQRELSAGCWTSHVSENRKHRLEA